MSLDLWGKSQVFIIVILACTFGTGKPKNIRRCQGKPILILGAGIAGIMAASTLQKNGIHNFLIIEGTDRIGGRIREEGIGPFKIPFGAGWIELTEGNPVKEEACDCNITGFIYDVEDFKVIDSKGKNVTDEADKSSRRFNRALDFADNYRRKIIRQSRKSDISVRAALRYGGWLPESSIDMVNEYFEFDFDAARPPDSSSIKFMNGRFIEPPYTGVSHFMFNQQAGFTQLPKCILQRDVPDWRRKIRLNTVVKEIDYNRNDVTVTTNTGRHFKGCAAIITFNLGVLQREAVRFKPPLPEWKREAIFGFSVTHFNHIYMRFPANKPWFVENSVTGYASERRGYFTIWHNLEVYIPGCRILQGFAVYEEALRLNKLKDEEVQKEAMKVLRIMFGNHIPDALETKMSRWSEDSLHYGSYSDWPTGFTAASFQALQAPLKPNVRFAGEATDDHYGYVHGAYLSGMREARRLARCLRHKCA